MKKELEPLNELALSSNLLIKIPVLVLYWFIFFFITIYGMISVFIARSLIKMKYKNAELLESHDILTAIGESVETSRFLAAFLCTGTIDIELFRQTLLEKFAKPNLRMRCCVQKEYGYFFLKEEENFNIEDHVLYHPELAVSTKKEWKKVQTDLYFKPLPKNVSPWFFHFVPLKPDYEGCKGEPSFYMVLAIDHTLCDAYSGARLLLKAISDFEPPELLVPHVPEISLGKKIFSHLKPFVLFSYFLTKNLNNKKKVIIDSERSRDLKFSENKILNREIVKKIKNATNVTFKEVLISCLTAAIEKHFRRSNFPKPPELILRLPQVLWKPGDKLTAVNNFVPISLQMPFEEKFCVDRLREINSNLNDPRTIALNEYIAFLMNYVMNLYPSRIIRDYYHGFEITIQISVTGTDRLPEYILGKRKMKNYVNRMIPMLARTAFGFQINTLGNDVFISAFSRLKMITEDDLGLILNYVEEELQELEKHILKSS